VEYLLIALSAVFIYKYLMPIGDALLDVIIHSLAVITNRLTIQIKQAQNDFENGYNPDGLCHPVGFCASDSIMHDEDEEYYDEDMEEDYDEDYDEDYELTDEEAHELMRKMIEVEEVEKQDDAEKEKETPKNGKGYELDV